MCVCGGSPLVDLPHPVACCTGMYAERTAISRVGCEQGRHPSTHTHTHSRHSHPHTHEELIHAHSNHHPLLSSVQHAGNPSLRTPPSPAERHTSTPTTRHCDQWTLLMARGVQQRVPVGQNAQLGLLPHHPLQQQQQHHPPRRRSPLCMGAVSGRVGIMPCPS